MSPALEAELDRLGVIARPVPKAKPAPLARPDQNAWFKRGEECPF